MYTEQNYKRNTFGFAPFFMSWTQRSKTFYVHKRPIFLKCSQICVSEHFSFAEIIHPPHRCSISRWWLDSMCLRLATIKGFSKMSSFTVWGGGGGVRWGRKTSQYLVWWPFASCSATHLFGIELIRLLIVACGICWSTPLQWLCEVAGYWRELEHTVI